VAAEKLEQQEKLRQVNAQLKEDNELLQAQIALVKRIVAASKASAASGTSGATSHTNQGKKGMSLFLYLMLK